MTMAWDRCCQTIFQKSTVVFGRGAYKEGEGGGREEERERQGEREGERERGREKGGKMGGGGNMRVPLDQLSAEQP